MPTAIQPAIRAALSPREFAASFGKHASWAYRLLYSGKIHAITELGRLLIPATELERVLNLAQRYDPKPEPQKQAKGTGDKGGEA